MARPRKNASSATSTQSENKVSSGQAAYVLERLLGERRISQGEINRYLSEMGREISELEARLQRLREAHGGQIAAAVAGVAAAAGAVALIRRGRRPGRPAGSGAGRPGRPAGRGPGRPAGRPAGRPTGTANATAATTGTDTATGGGTGAGTAGGGAKRGRKRRSAITSEQLASRQLQGRYLALVRQFAEGKRAQYAKIAKERGREAAIREMQDALKK